MNIVVKKCDYCGLDIRSDTAAYQQFAIVEEADGNRRDACPACIGKMRSR